MHHTCVADLLGTDDVQVLHDLALAEEELDEGAGQLQQLHRHHLLDHLQRGRTAHLVLVGSNKMVDIRVGRGKL